MYLANINLLYCVLITCTIINQEIFYQVLRSATFFHKMIMTNNSVTYTTVPWYQKYIHNTQKHFYLKITSIYPYVNFYYYCFKFFIYQEVNNKIPIKLSILNQTNDFANVLSLKYDWFKRKSAFTLISHSQYHSMIRVS